MAPLVDTVAYSLVVVLHVKSIKLNRSHPLTLLFCMNSPSPTGSRVGACAHLLIGLHIFTSVKCFGFLKESVTWIFIMLDCGYDQSKHRTLFLIIPYTTAYRTEIFH